MNRSLQQALASAGLDTVDVAARLEVDPKTVCRWIAGRVPHRQSRARLSALVHVPETDLWPEAAHRRTRGGTGQEIQTAYPHRWVVPRDVWREFFARAKHEIGVLVYSALFLAEDPEILQTFAVKAKEGVRVRLLLGDPSSDHVTMRGREEGIGDAMAARIRNARVLLRPLEATPGVEIRTHSTTLYNSIYRADDELLVNTHVYGQPATHSPVLHLCGVSGSAMVSTYIECFERVWEEGTSSR